MAWKFGIAMKTFALTCLMVGLLFGALAAQNDPYGETDTLYLDQVTAGPGQECIIHVNLWNDEELGGVTIPLAYPKEKLEYIGLDFSGGRIDYIGSKPVTIDTAAGTILVGAIVFFEAYIPGGDGSLFSLRFRIRDGVAPGEVLTIDSTRIPPAYLLLTHSSANNIIPVFQAGTVTVAEENRPPYFSPIPDQYVAEGDSLVVDIEAVDPEGGPVTLANPVHPRNSEFIDNGDGTGRFIWVPEYVGPESADMSPFEFVFWVSDGDNSGHAPMNVTVINVNRRPEISAPGQVAGEAGDSLSVEISCIDPDFETITWSIEGMPAAAIFDYENPGVITWASDYSDSGQFQLTIIAADPHGFADTAEMIIELAPVMLYSLRIDTVTSFVGRIVEIPVYLKNKNEIGAFRLRMNFDPALLTPLGVSFENTRVENFEFLDYRLNQYGIQGDVYVAGTADVPGGPDTPPLGDSEGPVCRITIQVTSNLSYVGNQVPIIFVNRYSDDNTLTRTDQTTVTRNLINYFNGYILIDAPGEALLGDINLNGLGFEISDAVYFSNFFIAPGQYPLNDQQLLNSDINQDGQAPSVADLVLLIRVIAGEVPVPLSKVATNPVVADVTLIRDNTGLYLSIESPVEVGGALFRLSGADIDRVEAGNLTEMDLDWGVWRDMFSCLLISYEAKTIPSGASSVIKLSSDPDLDITLAYIDLADADGGVLQINKKETVSVPDQFLLHQNVPNPFNPTTEIRFDLRTPTRVTLSVFNILGQEVICLADREYPAGNHAVVWDGRNANGEPVASGIYLYRIAAGTVTASRKMVLMK
ncbi:MAG: FlgD immunoglobulin-like domain containing protein [Candidatus Thorarchaeota archaeon]